MSAFECVNKQPELPGLSSTLTAAPFLKWAGGKGQLVERILRYAPVRFNRYLEPFLGGGAVFFALHAQDNLLNDSNDELMLVYRVVQSYVGELINALQEMPYAEEFYYQMRKKNPLEMGEVERAARFIYLNRTCFNGLYRVNRRNEFNVPFGRHTNPVICDRNRLLAANAALAQARIFSEDYHSFLSREAQAGDFIYVDPPYDPTSKYSDFKRYTASQFYRGDQWRLGQLVTQLVERGCYVLVSNSDTALVRELYQSFEINEIPARRNINKDANKRGPIKELLIVCRS